MNNRGFTVVELIAAFSITMVISLLLFELLIEVKDIFVETTIKTSIQQKTAIISKNINSLFKKTNNSVSCNSNTSCLINEKNIIINHSEDKKAPDYIIVGTQKFTMPKDGDTFVKINNPNLNIVEEGIIKISFKMTSNNLSIPYDYNIVFYYN